MSTSNYRQSPNLQPEAGPSKRKPSGSGSSINGRNSNININTNPQLSSEPWFAYPTPSPDILDGELPPYMESENYPMGHMLDRLSRKAHGDLKTLVTETLPKVDLRQRPRHVINYAASTRQAVLKYLAVLRWKTQVDVPTIIPAESQTGQSQSAFPTPHSNGDMYSPGLKGKGKMPDGDMKVTMRGKVTDAKRVIEYLAYQNSQHSLAIEHIQHTAKQLESLRVRNPDLLTALSLLTLGTYDRLPSNLTEAFIPRPALTNGTILDTLRRLDAHILYRLKCVDYVPPDLAIERISDGRAYVTGGNGSWRAELSLSGFGQDAQSRWWLTGVEWLWKNRSDEKGKSGKRFKGIERQEILDLVNREILPPEGEPADVQAMTEDTADVDGAAAEETKTVDAPLVRLVNFIQHLSLTYQLEVLFQQAMTLSREHWRNHLLVEIDRAKKSLILKYWIRARPNQTGPPGVKRPGNAPPPPQQQAGPRVPMLGATLSVTIGEIESTRTGTEDIRQAIAECDSIPSERLLRLGLKVKWEIGEAGAGGGWKAGDVRDEARLGLDPTSLSVDDILTPATRDHAAHLTRHYAAPLISNRTILIEPTLNSTDSKPLLIHVPVPCQKRKVGLNVSVSPTTGLLEIEDEGAKFSVATGGDERGSRTRQATIGVNASPAHLGDALKKLVIAIFTDNLESQMRQLGWSPARKLPIKLNELASSDLSPASTIFVPLPTCNLHHLIVRTTNSGLVFELLRLARVPAQHGPGMKLAVNSRSPLPLSLLRQRRQVAKDTRRSDKVEDGKASVMPVITEPEAIGFDVDSQDLKDLFILSNASVAKILVEQQLKDRSIPFTEKLPEMSGPNAPRSSSAVAGMIATIVVKVEDLLQDGRAAEVAMPLVYLQIKDWWKGGKCQVVTILQLQHRPSTATTGASPNFNDASTSSAARAEGITFDHASAVVKFTAKDISRCVPAFLEQWERLSKVIMVAGDVSRLNKLGVFRDLHMLSFDLRTASFSYAAGFNASITYSPTSDSYECTFVRASPVNTPVSPMVGYGEASPHEMLAPLLSHKLNELTKGADVKRGTVGREFISLLRNTLPLLLVIEGIRSSSTTGFPKLVVSSVEEYRLVWDTDDSKRHAITIHLIPNDRYLLIDTSTPASDGLTDISCGPLTPIPDLSTILDKVYTTLRSTYRDDGEKAGKVLAIKMDKGESLAVDVGVIGEVVRGICAEIDGRISAKGLAQ